MRALAVLFAAILCAASAAAPSAHAVKRSETLAGSFDDTWAAVIDAFSDTNTPLSTLDKGSGLASTDWLTLPSDSGEQFADCGSAPLAQNLGTQVRFNVRVDEEEKGKTTVVVNTSFRQGRRAGDQSGVVDCTSTGKLEELVHGKIDRRLEARLRRRSQHEQEAPPADAGVDGERTVGP